jgi:hypothetical protein
VDRVPCPGCSYPLELDQEVCGECRRPRDEYEIERGRELVREIARREARRPRVFAAGAAAAAAAVLLFVFRAPLLGWVAARRADLNQQFEDAENPSRTRNSAPHPPAEAGVLAAATLIQALSAAPPAHSPDFFAPAAAAPRTKAAAPKASPAIVPAAAAEAGAAKAALRAPRPTQALRRPPAAPVPPPTGSGQRILYGVVYDLITAKPVADAVVNLQFTARGGTPTPQNSMSRCTTDANGLYRLDLSEDDIAADNIVADVSAPHYRAGEMEDGEPPFYSRPPDQRRLAAAEATEIDLGSVPVRFASDDDVLMLNLVVLPESFPKPP